MILSVHDAVGSFEADVTCVSVSFFSWSQGALDIVVTTDEAIAPRHAVANIILAGTNGGLGIFLFCGSKQSLFAEIDMGISVLFVPPSIFVLSDDFAMIEI